MNSEKLLTVPEVAEILQVSPSTVYRRIQGGKLPAVKIGHRQVRIKQEDLDAYIDAHRITPTAPLDRPLDELGRGLGRGLSAGVGQPPEQEPADDEQEHNARIETTRQQSEIRNPKWSRPCPAQP